MCIYLCLYVCDCICVFLCLYLRVSVSLCPHLCVCVYLCLCDIYFREPKTRIDVRIDLILLSCDISSCKLAHSSFPSLTLGIADFIINYTAAFHNSPSIE